MIIQSLRVQNFGVYAGEHEINLAPASREQPIVLFGGLNGGGKTTLLDAIQLAFFGKLSRCSTRGNLAYEEFLRRSINHHTTEGMRSSVTLRIRQTFDAQIHDFVLHREWFDTAKGIVETLSVQRDGASDEELASNWLENVDQFVPLGLAELFFFDGEQIARLAEADNAAQMLSTAINTLLGIDLVDRLERDLTVYEREVTKSQRPGTEAVDVSERDEKLHTLNEELSKLTFERAQLQCDVDRLKKTVDEKSVNFQRQGGELFAKHKQIASDLQAATARRQQIEVQMRELAAGIAPLALLERQLEKVRRQADHEESADYGRVFVAELEKRDRALLSALKRDLAPQLRARIESFLKIDRRRRADDAAVPKYLNLDRSAVQNIQRVGSQLADIRKQIVRLRSDHSDLCKKIDRFHEMLERVPDEAAIAQVAEQLSVAQQEYAKAQAHLVGLDRWKQDLEKRVSDEEKAIALILEKNAIEAAANEDGERKIRFARRVRETMRKFRLRVLDRKIQQIEGFILESFQQLLRKKDLVTAICIDPSTYRLTLIGAAGKEIYTDRLSAGERQLLAVSTLWGLARASGRPLPTVIDTPLGRLDSLHRANLVENYFPYASHQVIILSTDEEIGTTHLAKLRPHITRTFELAYSSEKGSTSVTQGYFF